MFCYCLQLCNSKGRGCHVAWFTPLRVLLVHAWFTSSFEPSLLFCTKPFHLVRRVCQWFTVGWCFCTEMLWPPKEMSSSLWLRSSNKQLSCSFFELRSFWMLASSIFHKIIGGNFRYFCWIAFGVILPALWEFVCFFTAWIVKQQVCFLGI